MRIPCGEGRALSWDYKTALNSWGVAQVNWRVSQLIPLGPVKLKEFAQSAKEAESKHVKARHAYVEHIAACLSCSKKIVTI